MGAAQARWRSESLAEDDVAVPPGKSPARQLAGSLRGSLRMMKGQRSMEETVVLPDEPPRLTEEDKRYLKETWRTLESDPTTVGIITFTQLFEANPNVKDVFNTFREIEMEDVRKSQEMKQHAARVMGFVNKVISRLDSEDKYQPLMTDLGCRHLVYGAKPHYVDLMGAEFVSVIRPSLQEAHQWSDEAEQAWSKLFQVISYSMKVGIKTGMEKGIEPQEEATPRRSLKLLTFRQKSSTQETSIDQSIEY